jgi:hypothetical protein
MKQIPKFDLEKTHTYLKNYPKILECIWGQGNKHKIGESKRVIKMLTTMDMFSRFRIQSGQI